MPSPLEQFEILPLISIISNEIDFSITNATLFTIIALFFILSFFNMSFELPQVVSHSWQLFFETIYEASINLVYENIGERGKSFLPLIFVVFCFLITSNLVGMVPYSFTTTSHLIMTFSFALLLFLGLNLICVNEHKLHFFSLFLPSGSTLILAFILVPIEIVSYFFRVISLPVRLFANMMAGHTLLKVIAGFAWTMMSAGGFLFYAHYITVGLLILLIGLELGVALIQAYVFAILVCMYLNDAIHLH